MEKIRTPFISMLMILALLATRPVFAQPHYVLAGASDTGVAITDIVPDSVFRSQTASHTPYIGGEIRVDLDKNGSLDVSLASWGNGGLGGGAGGVVVQALDSSISIVSHTDTTPGCCPGTYIIEIADALSLNDTIGDGVRYGPPAGYAYLMNETYGGATGPNLHDWNNLGPKFIGVRMYTPSDTLFSWIKVSVDQTATYALCTFTVFEYGTLKSGNIGIAPVDKSEGMHLYPQPAANLLQLVFEDTLNSSCSIELYDEKGGYLFGIPGSRINGLTSTTVNTSQLPEGIYILKVIRPGGAFSKRISIAR